LSLGTTFLNRDPRRDEWATKILPKLKAVPLRELMERSGLPRSTLQAIPAGRRPHQQNRRIIKDVIDGNYAIR
jgi:hypothetical protein